MHFERLHSVRFRGFFVRASVVLFLAALFAGLVSGCSLVGQNDVVELQIEVTPENGGVTSPPSRQFTAGESITLRAIPNEQSEFQFEGWEGDIESDENPMQLTITSDTRVVARFMQKPHTLTITIEGEGTVQHRLARDENEFRSETVGRYENGDLIELQATPSPGWEFDQWRGENFTFNRPTNPEFLNIWDDIELRVVFREVSP